MEGNTSRKSKLAVRHSPIPEDPNESMSDIVFERNEHSTQDPAPSPSHQTSFSALEAGIDAICINCLDYISYNDIDEHSRSCHAVSVDPLTLDEEVAVKLRKLHRGISGRLRFEKGEVLMAMMRLRELAGQIASMSKAALQSVEMELEELAIVSLGMPSGIPCSIYARRILTIVNDKALLLDVGKAPDEEVETNRKELLRWRTETKERLDEVNSDLASESNTNGCGLSEVSCGLESEIDVGDLEAADEALRQLSEEQLKKYFYSVCLKQKLLLPKHHPKQKLLISTLYEEVQSAGLPVSKWEKFIIGSLVG